jgi:hypothetical protein
MGDKLLALYGSNIFIENELLAPVHLSQSGQNLLGSLTSPANIVGSEQSTKSSKQNVVESAQVDARVIRENKEFITASKNSAETKSWLFNNSILIDRTAAFRGKFFHHYSTILYPLREIREGHLTYGLTSQYGLITLLPLMVTNHPPFIYYGLLSLSLLLAAGVFLIIWNRALPRKMVIIATLIAVIALTIDIPAIRLSPGFTYLRYFPLVALLFVANLQLSKASVKVFFVVGLLLSILNSVQFNLLFLIISISSYLYILFVQKSPLSIKILLLPLAVFIVSCIQVILYFQQSNSFTPNLFSSVGEGGRSTIYSVAVLLMLIMIKLLSSVSLKNILSDGPLRFQGLRFENPEILAFVSYALCATYAISFAGSPQHFSGFMVMASYSVYVVFMTNVRGVLKTTITIILIFSIPYSFGFLKLSQPFEKNNSKEYNYYQIGRDLVFNSALNLEALSRDFDAITRDYASKGSIYFLSRDKVFIETYKDINLSPRIYDVYLNLYSLTPKSAIFNLKKDNAKYLVLDSAKQREHTRNLVNIFGNSANPSEVMAHKVLLNNLDSLSDALKSKVLACNNRYCIYELD